MPTDYISDWQIVDSADHAYPLTFTVFGTQLEALEWVRAHEADLYEATKSGTIGGTYYKESRTPATFVVSTDAAVPYLNFGARIVATVYAGDIPLRLIGVPREHASYLLGRLASGLVRRAGPFATLEEAQEQARLGL